MSGDSFSVDYDQLEEVGHELATLADDIDGVEDNVEPYQAAVGLPPDGGRDLEHEIHEFGDNWKQKRDKIVGRLDELSEMAIGAAEGYRETDEGISAELQE